MWEDVVMRTGTLIALAALAVAAGSAFAAEDEWLPATVTLSDGTVLQGRVHVTDDSIVLYNEAQARRYTVRMAEMKALETAIERQAMEQKWIFRESGLDDKVFTGETYPVRHYRTRITFHDGRQLEGGIMPKTIYVESGGERQRFILRAQQEGKVGQTLQDLLYVQSIVFTAAGEGVRGSIEGTLKLPDLEQVQRVLAVNCDGPFSVEGSFHPLRDTFRVADCTAGTYDLLVVTDRSIYACFSRERAEECARLDSSRVAELQAWVNKLRDFFQEQTIIYAAGDEKRIFALVRQERHGGTTLPGAELVRRHEVWVMHKPQDEWQIEKRMFLDRLVSEQAVVPRRRLCIVPALAGHRIAKGAEALTLTVDLTVQGEPPIPPPPEPQEPPRGD
jgi:hypothetical protein